MKPSLTYTVTCPCGWTYGPGLRTDVGTQARWHQTKCEVWK